MRYLFKSFLSADVNYRVMLKKHLQRPILDHHDYHPHYEIYYSRGGIEQSVIVNGQQMVICTPAIIISEPFSIHGMSRADNLGTDFERFVVYFNDSFISRFSEGVLPEGLIKGSANCIYPLDEETNSAMSVLFERLLDAAECSAEFSAYFAAILNTLTRKIPSDARIDRGGASHYIVDVLKYIYEHRNRSLETDEIAKAFHVSRAKLDRDFRRFVGQSVHKTVTHCRVDYVTELLTDTELKIGEISKLAGFESEYYFYSFFKSNTGKTPRDVRKMRDSAE